MKFSMVLVLAEKTTPSSQYFQSLQKIVSMDLDSLYHQYQVRGCELAISEDEEVDLTMATSGEEKASDEIINIKCSICAEKNITREAEKHCIECQAYYCIPCSDLHKMFPLMRGHKLLDKTSFDSTQMQATVPCFPTEVCSIHKARLLEMFCKDHDEIVCATCVALNHRICKDIHSIPDEVDTLFQRSETVDVNIQLNAATKAMENMKKAKKDLISKLDKHRKLANDSIRKRRKEMEALLEKLEKESIKEVEAEYRKNEALLHQQIKEIESLTNDLEQSAEKLKKSDGNNAQEFVCVKASLKSLRKMKKAERLLQGPLDVVLEFVTDPKIQNVLQEEKTFGQITTKISKYTQRSTVYAVKKQREVCVKETSDACDCRILGSCFTEDGSLLLTDYENKKLKLVDMSTDCIQEGLSLEAKPISVCLTDADEAAVSLDNKTIQFVSFKNKLSAGRQLELNHVCYGIACKDNKLFMTDQDKAFYIYDSVGTRLHSFTAGTSACPVLEKSRHVSLSNKQDKVYVAECTKGLITLDLQGNYQSCLTFPDVPIPQGVCVDGRGNIFLSSWGSSNSVIQISEQSNTTLGVLANVTNTYSICFNPQQNILVVTACGKNSVTVLELE